jgi:hypothetical protein
MRWLLTRRALDSLAVFAIVILILSKPPETGLFCEYAFTIARRG